MVDQLRTDGKVVRGYLGVQVQPVTKDIAEGLGLDKAKGALVDHAESGTPAAKAGLNAMTEGLALAFGPTVRVNTLMPGPFLTDVSAAWDFGGNANPFADSALQRAGQPAEIVGAALFLMSDASSFTTGSILRADGGSV